MNDQFNWHDNFDNENAVERMSLEEDRQVESLLVDAYALCDQITAEQGEAARFGYNVEIRNKAARLQSHEKLFEKAIKNPAKSERFIELMYTVGTALQNADPPETETTFPLYILENCTDVIERKIQEDGYDSLSAAQALHFMRSHHYSRIDTKDYYRIREKAIAAAQRNYAIIKRRYSEGDSRSKRAYFPLMCDVGVSSQTYAEALMYVGSDVDEIEGLCLRPETELQKIGRAKLAPLLEQYGLNSSDMLEAWMSAGYATNKFEPIKRNLWAIERLERMQPGIAGLLRKNFGIRHFRRYPTELLIKQMDEAEAKGDFGIAMYPVEDHNNAYNLSSIHAQVGNVIQKLDSRCRTRIYEAAGADEVFSYLKKAYQKNGELSYLLLGGHGNAISILFGKTSFHGFLRIDRINSGFGRVISKFLKPTAPIILPSCSTGEPNGIAQKINTTTGRKVIASAHDVYAHDVEIDVDILADNSLDFRIVGRQDEWRFYS